MITKICIECNKSFITKERLKKYCNKECYYHHLRNNKLDNPFYGKIHSEEWKNKHSKDITNQKFGRLTAIRFDHDEYRINKNKLHYNYWLFRCDCGKNIVIEKTKVMKGNTKSCGCYRKEMYIIVGGYSNLKHGGAKRVGKKLDKFYKTWTSIKERCLNKNHFAYDRYGGRGIKICERWNDFSNFKEDMYESYLEHLKNNNTRNTSLDRFPDNNGDYCPENCRWATMKEQNNNRRSNHLITYKYVTI